MTLSANMLGLGNAVTPLGLKLCSSYKPLTPKRYGYCSYVHLMALCYYRLYSRSGHDYCLTLCGRFSHPTEIVGSTLIVSLFATILVLIVDRLCQMICKTVSKGDVLMLLELCEQLSVWVIPAVLLLIP